MTEYLTIPHLTAAGMCPVNGIRDLIEWRTGRNWSNEFVYGLGQGGGFAYLRFKSADPPRQVYWGIAGPRQHRYLAELFNAGFTEVDNRSFKFSWQKVKNALQVGTPPVIGPLDMYYLPFYEGIYHKRHIPIHYLLVVDYNEESAYVLDTGSETVQALPLAELQLAWNVNVPGLGKRGRLVAFEIPSDIPPNKVLIRKSILDQCKSMLHPPVSMVGIPAMKKLAREISGWLNELGDKTATKCLQQVREYLNSPPDLEGDHLTAGRNLYITFLQQAADMAEYNFNPPIELLQQSMSTIPKLAVAIKQKNLEQATYFQQIADYEGHAYSTLNDILKD